jgi:hypothetical protein
MITELVKAPPPNLRVEEVVAVTAANGLSASVGAQPPGEPEEASSPWGEFLRYKKTLKDQQHGAEVKDIQSIIKPQKAVD